MALAAACFARAAGEYTPDCECESARTGEEKPPLRSLTCTRPGDDRVAGEFERSGRDSREEPPPNVDRATEAESAPDARASRSRWRCVDCVAFRVVLVGWLLNGLLLPLPLPIDRASAVCVAAKGDESGAVVISLFPPPVLRLSLALPAGAGEACSRSPAVCMVACSDLNSASSRCRRAANTDWLLTSAPVERARAAGDCSTEHTKQSGADESRGEAESGVAVSDSMHLSGDWQPGAAVRSCVR